MSSGVLHTWTFTSHRLLEIIFEPAAALIAEPSETAQVL